MSGESGYNTVAVGNTETNRYYKSQDESCYRGTASLETGTAVEIGRLGIKTVPPHATLRHAYNYPAIHKRAQKRAVGLACEKRATRSLRRLYRHSGSTMTFKQCERLHSSPRYSAPLPSPLKAMIAASTILCLRGRGATADGLRSRWRTITSEMTLERDVRQGCLTETDITPEHRRCTR
jgi:hypothetical protein